MFSISAVIAAIRSLVAAVHLDRIWVNCRARSQAKTCSVPIDPSDVRLAHGANSRQSAVATQPGVLTLAFIIRSPYAQDGFAYRRRTPSASSLVVSSLRRVMQVNVPHSRVGLRKCWSYAEPECGACLPPRLSLSYPLCIPTACLLRQSNQPGQGLVGQRSQELLGR